MPAAAHGVDLAGAAGLSWGAMSDQRDRVLDQFTRQAEPFSKAAPITDETALRPVLEATGAGPADDVLDVACGPGIVVCAFARIVRVPRESISPRP